MEKFIATTRDINSKNLNEFESSLASQVNLRKVGRNATQQLNSLKLRAQPRYGNNNNLIQAKSSDVIGSR